MKDYLTLKGEVEGVIEWKDGRKQVVNFSNSVLRNGRMAIAASLSNNIGDSFDHFISRMLFGDGGTSGGVPRRVDETRSGLFGTAQLSKPIIANIDPTNPTQAIFTSVISFSEGNNITFNEMALQMNSGIIYSMATFPGISKTPQMQITWSWKLLFI